MRTLDEIVKEQREKALFNAGEAVALAGLLGALFLWSRGGSGSPDAADAFAVLAAGFSVLGAFKLLRSARILRFRITPDGVVRRSLRGRLFVPWRRVTRVDLGVHRLVIEAGPGVRMVVSSEHAEELYWAICALVPLTAFEGLAGSRL